MKTLKTIILILFAAGITIATDGQTYELSKAGTEVIVKGTSSLHDWEMDLKVVNSGFQLDREGTLLKDLDNVTFSFRATDLKSESNLMDKKAYDALKADVFPEIKFSGISTSGITVDEKKFKGSIKGKLNVAGQSQDVTIPFNGTFIDNKTINIIASADLAMSSFNITPPTAMMGALKTGDKVNVSFSLQFVQKAQ